MERRVIISAKKRENKGDIVYIHYTGEHSLLKLIRVAQRMAPTKIVIQNPVDFPEYEVKKAMEYVEGMKGICPQNFFCFR